MEHKLKQGLIQNDRMYGVSVCGETGRSYRAFWRKVTCKDCINLITNLKKRKKLLEKMK